ncbi:MAG: D-alanyl-D-alanine carboxypeptidase [Deltaproteobacteria bacterium]|nr:D-alanyl-D-alanine carboxypeptidase [Deltaproteobacteria bacterium]
MRGIGYWGGLCLWACIVLAFPARVQAVPSFTFNARSAILIDMTTGQTLFEQDADLPIAPASLTKLLTLYVVFDAIKSGELHLHDNVHVSRRAARTGGSRMGLRGGTDVSVEELIKGMAVVSGNDACVAIAEHMSGTVEEFVSRMNRQARELGMVDSRFKTPNGLPAKGQLTTARDMAKLSLAYLQRFPDSLSIHSMRSYTYQNSTHKNANRLLGNCPGVDGLKTGFVCASGYNLSATAKRGDVRLIAVLMGASSPSIRACETTKLLEYGYHKVAPHLVDTKYVQAINGKPEFILPEEGACRIRLQAEGRVASKGQERRFASQRATRPRSSRAETTSNVRVGRQKAKDVPVSTAHPASAARAVVRSPKPARSAAPESGKPTLQKSASFVSRGDSSVSAKKTAAVRKAVASESIGAKRKAEIATARGQGGKPSKVSQDPTGKKAKASVKKAESCSKPDPQVRNAVRKKEKVL